MIGRVGAVLRRIRDARRDAQRLLEVRQLLLVRAGLFRRHHARARREALALAWFTRKKKLH